MNAEKSGFLYKIWDMLHPFILYYVLYFVAFNLLVFLLQSVMAALGQNYENFSEAHEAILNGLVNGAAMLAASAFLVPMLRRELQLRKEKCMPNFLLIAVLSVTSSLGLNILLSLTGLTGVSDTFQDVTARQFGVPFGLGIVLYGFVSPVAEEMVFRGLMYNRMRKYYPAGLAIVLSGLFFGLYHGNPVQGIYGTCMGILMAYLYERTGHFYLPLLVHMLANLSVFVTAYVQGLQHMLFKPINCVILLTISVICLIVLEKGKCFEKNRQ